MAIYNKHVFRGFQKHAILRIHIIIYFPVSSIFLLCFVIFWSLELESLPLTLDATTHFTWHVANELKGVLFVSMPVTDFCFLNRDIIKQWIIGRFSAFSGPQFPHLKTRQWKQVFTKVPPSFGHSIVLEFYSTDAITWQPQ